METVSCLVIFQKNNHWTEDYNFQYGSSFDLGISAACLSGLAFITGLFTILYSVDKDAKPHGLCCRRHHDDVELLEEGSYEVCLNPVVLEQAAPPSYDEVCLNAVEVTPSQM